VVAPCRDRPVGERAMSARRRTIAIVGGTGKQGRGLATRLAAAGHDVVIGSRTPERAADAAADVRRRLAAAGREGPRIAGLWNCAAIPAAEIAVITVPFAALDDLLAQCGSLLAEKIVVDVTVPVLMTAERVELVAVPEGSASVLVQRRVPGARVVAAFKNVAASHLLRLERHAEGDIPIAGDDAAAKTIVAELVREIPALRPVDAGPLANAGLLESLTALELNLNRLHKAVTSIRLLGIG
jgi:NADPH-dependent F420 reductase